MLRFAASRQDETALVLAFARLTGVDVRDDAPSDASAWRSVTDHLIAWDLPAPPDYREHKSELFLVLEPRWGPSSPTPARTSTGGWSPGAGS